MAANREPWPDDTSRATATVALLVSEIRMSEDADRDDLIQAFLRNAWPTRRSQGQ